MMSMTISLILCWNVLFASETGGFLFIAFPSRISTSFRNKTAWISGPNSPPFVNPKISPGGSVRRRVYVFKKSVCVWGGGCQT